MKKKKKKTKSLIYFNTGNGGDAGRQNIGFIRLQGMLDLKTCRGTGGQAAKNGAGGDGKSTTSCK